MEQRTNSNSLVGPRKYTSRRQVSLAVESDQVIAGHTLSGASVYSISNWLDEQLRNPLAAAAAPKRSFHGYIIPLHHFIVSREKKNESAEKRDKTKVTFRLSSCHRLLVYEGRLFQLIVTICCEPGFPAQPPSWQRYTLLQAQLTCLLSDRADLNGGISTRNFFAQIGARRTCTGGTLDLYGSVHLHGRKCLPARYTQRLGDRRNRILPVEFLKAYQFFFTQGHPAISFLQTFVLRGREILLRLP
jgi:hypothetical protein